jgi:hypothetical protein
MPSRSSAPLAIKRVGRRLQPLVGERTAGLRLSPSFLIVGAQRCGTTSMYRALMAHPQVLSPVFRKGIAYFDVSYERGMAWYLGHFPLAVTARRRHPHRVTFESSGYYAYHPHAPARIGRDLPGIKLVLMVRDPVERAYSAHKHEYARGFETLPFEQALEQEDSRIEPELERMLQDPTYVSIPHRHQSYRRRGHYIDQIEQLEAAVGRGNLHIVQSEEFFEHPDVAYGRLLEFLDLEPFVPSSFDRYNARPRAPMNPRTRHDLDQHFAPYDERLSAYLGQPPAWRR